LVAQSPAGRVANPEAVEFDIASPLGLKIDGYLVERFPAGSGTKSATPIKAVDFPATPSSNEGKLRSQSEAHSMGYLTANPSRQFGQFALTCNRRDEPTQPFLVSHSKLVQDRVVDHRERSWTKVAIAIGAGTMIIRFIVR
jgi:hypothetical protein